MKHLTIFSVSFLFCLQLQAQWSVFHSGKYHDLNVSTANKQVAIYGGIACEVQLESKKNKTLKLTSSNATIKQNSASSYTITTNESIAIVQIYSVQKSKMKMLAEVSIPAIEVPIMTELNLYGNEIQVGYNMADFVDENYALSLYDSLVYYEPREILNWNVEIGTDLYTNLPLWSFNGNGSFLSNEVMNIIRFAPAGTGYRVSANYESLNFDPYQQMPTRVFTISEQELPVAKYLIINNTPQNKAWFDPKDQSSFIGMLNNNYFIEPDLSKGILNRVKTSPKEGDFIGPISDGLDNQSVKDLKNNILLNYFWETNPTKNDKFILLDDIAVPVFVKKGFDPSVKEYVNWDPQIEELDTITETINPSEAAIIPGTEDEPIFFPVEYRIKTMNLAYTTDSIQQIIIRYDSVWNVTTGSIEIQPSRISLARKFGKNDLADIVFSMKIKDLVKFQSFAPTIHLKNDKTNASIFDLENPSSLLGYLNSTNVRESDIANFPMLNNRGPLEFGDDCDPSGKSDSKLIEVKTTVEPIKNEKVILSIDGVAVPVYVKKGFSTAVKEYEYSDLMLYQIDPITETIDATEAEVFPGTTMPYIVEYRVKEVKKSQYKGLTDLFIKRQYLYDPTFGIFLAKPISIGFAQQIPGQAKPTLIMQVDVASDPKLMNILPKMQSQLFLDQPWASSLLQNEIDTLGETIDASNIPALQKKFQFRKKMVSILGEMEVVSEPHF
jgi:hypothetical protein